MLQMSQDSNRVALDQKTCKTTWLGILASSNGE